MYDDKTKKTYKKHLYQDKPVLQLLKIIQFRS